MTQEARLPNTFRIIETPGLIHHGVVFMHTALSVLQFLAIENTAVAPHPSYQPHLAHYNFFVSACKTAAMRAQFPACS
jgi:hypothetical protein